MWIPISYRIVSYHNIVWFVTTDGRCNGLLTGRLLVRRKVRMTHDCLAASGSRASVLLLACLGERG